MATPHIESKLEDISKTVLMPGDPLRAKYIAENFLTDVRVVNNVRNILAYTGKYKQKEITVFASGMGIPSIGIYAYELYKFYNVEKIIRIGSCGSGSPNVKVHDVVLASSSYSLSDFALLFSGVDIHEEDATCSLNKKIMETADRLNMDLKEGPIVTSDIFDVYVDKTRYLKLYPDKEFLAHEMESFALFHLAHILNRSASCLLTVVDSAYEDVEVSASDREKSLNNMILLALESIL